MRKTNLFYSLGQDSNFVTFSNYTEALTGNILATNAKMFPSKFICLYIPLLANATNYDNAKQQFITDYLSGYYENKLAVIRDYCINHTPANEYLSTNPNLKPEAVLNPLDYLLDIIYYYDPNTEITFIGDICEQEYNGTFMDNICIIENNASARLYEYTKNVDNNETINVKNIVSDNYKNIKNWQSKLYGWASGSLPENYSSVNPIYENAEEPIYFYKSNSTVEFSESIQNIRFNVLIPLFDVMLYNLNDNGQTTNDVKPEALLVLNSADTNNQYDTPMGMWFSDKVINLERNDQINGKYRPSWSLCISSQFKPFPYSDNYPNEIDDYKNPDKFASFAMIMAKQAFIMNEFDNLSQNYTQLNSQMNKLENYIKSKTELNISDNENSSSNNNSNISNEDIQRLTNQISQLNSKFANYISRQELNQAGYITLNGIIDSDTFVTKSEFDNMHYLTESDMSDYLKTTDLTDALKANTYIKSITNVTDNGFKSKLNEYISATGNISIGNASTLGQRFYYLCGGSTSPVFSGSGVQVTNPGYTIPGLWERDKAIINSYQSADEAILERISKIDGIGFDTNQGGGVTSNSFAGNVQEAFDKLEDISLPTIKNLLAYLLIRTTLFGGVKYTVIDDVVYGNNTAQYYGDINGTNDSEYIRAIDNLLKSADWSEIYKPAGNNQNNNQNNIQNNG